MHCTKSTAYTTDKHDTYVTITYRQEGRTIGPSAACGCGRYVSQLAVRSAAPRLGSLRSPTAAQRLSKTGDLLLHNLMKNQAIIRTLTILLFVFLAALFLIAILLENSTINLILISSILVNFLFGVYKTQAHRKNNLIENYSLIVWLILGALACYALNVTCGLGSVLAASIVGTVASFIPSVKRDSNYLKKLPAPIYCGAFVGMSSTIVAPSFLFVFFAASIAGLLFILSQHVFVGVGGKLGTIAFGGVVLSSFLAWLFV